MDEPDRDGEGGDEPATIECSMCKRRVPIGQTRYMSGRSVCFACLSSWYDDEDDV
jgi:hypothetical protein